MAKKSDQEPEVQAPAPNPTETVEQQAVEYDKTPSNLIKTVSELEEMTPEQKQAFRDAGGTVTSDPAK